MIRLKTTQMYKLIILISCILILSACNSAEERDKQLDSHIDLFVDEETGCEYIHRYQGGITPRMDSDGITHKGCIKAGIK